jgi:hypothetical protein
MHPHSVPLAIPPHATSCVASSHQSVQNNVVRLVSYSDMGLAFDRLMCRSNTCMVRAVARNECKIPPFFLKNLHKSHALWTHCAVNTESKTVTNSDYASAVCLSATRARRFGSTRIVGVCSYLCSRRNFPRVAAQ